MKKKITNELSFWDKLLVKRLSRKSIDISYRLGEMTMNIVPSPTAEAIIRQAFPGYALKKIRKDAGKKKHVAALA